MSGKSDTPLSKKIENFVKYNWFSMSILYAFGSIFMVYSYYSITDSIEVTNKLIKKHISSVVLMTPDGRAVSVVRSKLNPNTDGFKILISRVIIDSLVVDGSSITNGFNDKSVKNIGELYKNSSKINYFAKNFLSPGEATKNKYKSFMTYLLGSLNNDTLPEYIVPFSSEITSFRIKPDDTFSIQVKIKYTISAFYVEDNKWSQKSGEAIYSASGNFDLTVSTENNPMGLKFFDFTVPKILKHGNSR